MKVTIEHDGKTEVYEDVKLFAGAVVMGEKTSALSITDIESDDVAKMLVKENRYVMAENIVGLIFKAEGMEPFVEAERSEE